MLNMRQGTNTPHKRRRLRLKQTSSGSRSGIGDIDGVGVRSKASGEESVGDGGIACGDKVPERSGASLGKKQDVGSSSSKHATHGTAALSDSASQADGDVRDGEPHDPREFDGDSPNEEEGDRHREGDKKTQV